VLPVGFSFCSIYATERPRLPNSRLYRQRPGDLIPKNRSPEWVDPHLIGIAVGQSAPEFKSCCGVYLRNCNTTDVPALLPSTGLLLNSSPILVPVRGLLPIVQQ
jgi:hypothetical protein